MQACTRGQTLGAGALAATGMVGAAPPDPAAGVPVAAAVRPWGEAVRAAGTPGAAPGTA